MGKNMTWMTVCLLSLLFSFARSSIPITLTAQTGIHFSQILHKDDFFTNENNIQITASVDQLPDMPKWLKLEQKNPNEDAIIYGTPDKSDVTTVMLEIIAWNKETYDTKRKVVLLTVLKSDQETVNNQLEFKVRNKDSTELFKENNLFLKTVQKFWPNAGFVTLIERPIHRKGGSYPLPGQKEGVFVKVGGTSKPPKDLTVLKRICSRVPSDNAEAKVFSEAGFDIDWCSLQEISPVANPASSGDNAFQSADAFEPASFKTEEFDNKPENLTLDIVFLFIPLAMGLSFIVILTCVMCFNREGTQKRYAYNSREKLLKQKAMKNHKSNVENDNGFAYGQLDEEKTDSRSGTPNRLNGSKINDVENGTLPLSYRTPPKVNGRKVQDSKF